MRVDGRSSEELRKIEILPGVNPYAEGSVQVSFGKTRVLVTASVERTIPPWMKEGMGGWITAEYGMLPRATHSRSRREAAAGKQSGRTLEIQRLIGRSLRAAVDLKSLEGITINFDCDVLVADGGTRTAAISGGWVALVMAIRWLEQANLVAAPVETKPIAAVSVGSLNQHLLLDLCYEEDSQADFDLNIVANDKLELIEIQGTAEHGPLSVTTFNKLIELGMGGIRQVFQAQEQALQLLSR